MSKTGRLGDRAEAAFLCRAMEEGLEVARPFSASLRYDFVLDNGTARLLVQVKYTAQQVRPGVYVVRTARQEHSGNRRSPKTVLYLPGEIDFVAVFLAVERSWYVLPFAALRGRKSITLYAPGLEGQSPDGVYLERWDLFWKWVGGRRLLKASGAKLVAKKQKTGTD